ncbi:MAG: FAD-dependent monooxygenase [Acinetobacter sp.]|nr:FAD-dependent monooxygenase [Acinetobacter sp.]
MTQTQKIHDVIIVGGGLVGGLTALLLAQGGVQAIVLDASPVLDVDKILAVHNPRALALTQATIQLLKCANVWQSLLQTQRTLPFTGMQAWNNHGYGEILLGKATEQPYPHEILGVMVEPSVLNVMIQQQLLQQIQDYRPNSRVQRLEKITQQGQTLWQIDLHTGERLLTKLVIGADGANSLVREQAMIGLDVLDYQQSVISCVLKSSEHHQHVARQMYNPTPFALLPMAGQTPEQNGYLHSLAWTVWTQDAEHYLSLSPEEFSQAVNKASQYMLGTLQVLTEPTAFPLKARSAQRYIDDGLALVGDAAHTIHPLAGQGMNLGLLDAAVLCDVLLHDLQRGQWAKWQTLQRYEHHRKGHNARMMHSMSAMGFGERFQDTPLRWVLNFGRKTVNQSALIKQFLMQQASGLQQLQHTRYAVV